MSQAIAPQIALAGAIGLAAGGIYLINEAEKDGKKRNKEKLARDALEAEAQWRADLQKHRTLPICLAQQQLIFTHLNRMRNGRICIPDALPLRLPELLASVEVVASNFIPGNKKDL